MPTESLTEIFLEPIDVRLVDAVQGNGNTTLLEQIVIITLAKRHKAQKVFEFGTFDGKTSANLAANLGDQAEILTIDLPASEASAANLPISKNDLRFIMKDVIGEKSRPIANVQQLYGDTARFNFSPWYNSCDLVFIDACHEYEYAKNDTEIAFKLLKPKGVVIWHDYGGWEGVTRALNEYHLSDSRFKDLRHVKDTTICVLVRS